MWSESYADWELLTRPFSVRAPGSKIIITTRKLQLLTKLRCYQPHSLHTLSYDDALSLFCQNAFDENNFDSHLTLKPHGEDIVKKCDGLPLALVALGRLSRTKANEEEWKELSNSEIWNNENEIIPALRLSYNDLRSHLKQLFAYCCLFPKDYVFDKEELILLWMAEGFSQQSSTESLGRECFEELLSRSFFQHAPDDESLYMMHDLMNDLATVVAGDFFFRLVYEMDVEVKNEALQKCRHMSFVRQQYEVYKKFKVLERAKSTRTLLAVSVGVTKSWQRFYLSKMVLVELLSQLTLLRVLHLTDYEISEVPESIGSLNHLRYLNLSRTMIICLPEQVGNLYNLQTLLCDCHSLKTLPSNFLKLKNLRHLDITNTPCLEKMPFGIGKLKSLQTLSKVIIEGRSDGFAITELKGMKDLHGRLSIEGLDKVENAVDANEANLLQKGLSELELKWSDVFDGCRKERLENKVLNVLKPNHVSLKNLKIESYGGIEFPSWVGDPSFPQLTHVTLRGCKRCTSLPPLGQLPLLKELFVGGMDGVKVVGPEVLGYGNFSGGVAFPSLEKLSFENMPGWEVWSTKIGDIFAVFPRLRELFIEECDKLVEASLEALPALRVLDISRCGDGVLRSVVQAASLVTKLEISYVSGLTQLDGGIVKHLGAIEELRVNGCDEVRYLWESEAEACKILVNLRTLEVEGCNNLVCIGEREEDNSLTSLRQVTIYCCDSLERYNCPNDIESLTITDCSSITSVSFPTGGQKLQSRMSLSFIRTWPNLKLFPHLSFFLHLTTLKLINCENLESFPDEELPKLISLTNMEIMNCPSMDDLFPRGHWPPKLTSLKIGGLKKPISEWGPQNFPTSLVRLSLNGTSSSDVCSGSQLFLLLPSSLMYLWMYEFEKLESLSMGLQHLTSLEKLSIEDCPNLRDLPVTLLPSLLELRIISSPKLEKRCGRKGSYWPQISHIPSIQIN